MTLTRTVLTTLALLTATTAQAATSADRAIDQYPAKPVRFIVPFPPGALNDYLGRMLAAKFTENWGKQMVVDNRAGGSTIIGTEMAAKSPPDGYTLLLCSVALAVNQTLFPKLPYNTNKDLTFVSMVAATPYLVVVQPSLPVKTLQDLVALAKAKPGTLNYGSPGNGTQGHLVAEFFKQITKVDLTHIPYKGASGAVTDLMAGHIHSVSTTLSTASVAIRSGRARALAISSSARLTDYPAVPTYRELGYPELVATIWFSLSGPAGMPPDVVTKLNTEVRRILQLPDVRERLRPEGIDPGTLDPKAFTEFLASEVKRWAPVVRTSGAQAN